MIQYTNNIRMNNDETTDEATDDSHHFSAYQWLCQTFTRVI